MKKIFLLLSTISLSTISFGQCQAAFTYSVNGSTVDFTDASTGNNLIYSWTFGDGGSSSQTNPSNTYTNTGWYGVCLTIYNMDSLNACQSYTCDSIYVVADSMSTNCDAGATFDVTPNGTIQGTATSTGAYSVLWSVYDASWNFLNNTWISPLSYNPGSPGLYNVCLVAYDSLQFECDSACYQVTVPGDSLAGIDPNEKITLNIYPNPSSDVITISADSKKIDKISILDVTGSVVLVREVIEERTKVNIIDYPKGLYFVHAIDHEGNILHVSKVIKY